MSQASDIRTQFNAGEMSPLLEGRVDFAKYAYGCRQLENFIPTVQGPVKRRQGSRYVASTKNLGQQVWLKPFQASNQEQYVLEFGHLYLRFFTNHGVLLDGAVPYELVTPYTAAELLTAEGTCALQMVQSNDVLYIVHAGHAPAKLTRTGVGTFTFTQNAVGVSKDGPFKDLNADETILITASGDGVTPGDYTGALSAPNITLTASTGIFLDGMVGKYFYLQEGKNILVAQWETAKAITAGNRRRSDSLNYIATTTTTTGNVKPVHLSGIRFDGNTGVEWLFTDDGSGVVRIDSLVGAQPTNVVNATVVKRLPFSVTTGPGGATHRWAAAAWTANDGFPDCVCFFRERLVFARGQSLWMSVAADFENFSTREGGQIVADSAIIMTIVSDKKDRIEWLKPETQLLVGTASGEFAVAEYSNGAPLGPANVRAQRQSSFGSRAIVPITVGAAVLFVEKGGRRVREMSFDIRQNQYQSVDVTVLAEHVTKATGLSPSQKNNTYDGILDWSFAARPDHVLWAARADGVLLGFTYNREQDVTAWHRHKLGNLLDGGVGWGVVESVCAIGSPDGTQEDLWLVVKRGANRHVEWIGQPVQTEVMNTPWGGQHTVGAPDNLLGLTAQQLASTALWELDAFYVDGGLSKVPNTVWVQPLRQVVFLTAGSTWNVPASWNPKNNSVECIGGGGGGRSTAAACGGGGGGGYSKRSNLTLSGAISYAIGAGGAVNAAGGDTYFNGASVAASTVGAKGGASGAAPAGGAGGAAASGMGTTRHSGGAGGAGAGANLNGGGGGGAGGPAGDGGPGGPGKATVGGGGGGIGNAGGTGIGNALIVSGADGAAGTNFDATHGSGTGGDGAGVAFSIGNQEGGAGGLYGAGGGGGEGTHGAGSQGLIVISWTPHAGDTVESVSGLDHLEGKTVQVVTDGSTHPDRVVTGGAIDLNGEYFTVHVGLKAPALLETTQFNSGSQDGTAQGKEKRIHALTIRLDQSKDGRFGPDAEHLDEINYRRARDRQDTYVKFFTGDLVRLPYPAGFEETSRIYILQDRPFPFTLCALMPQLVTR